MIRLAQTEEIDYIIQLVRETIKTIYPRYYPKGAVDFFLAHHPSESLKKDIDEEKLYVYVTGHTMTGTITIHGNEITRLFVRPTYQHQGYGQALLDFAEALIFTQYDTIQLDASLPAKSIYLKRGYKEIAFHRLDTANGDYLCYDEMFKNKEERL